MALPYTAGHRGAQAPASVVRRVVLGGLAAAATSIACTRAQPLAGVVAIPERSLTYAPLLLAMKQSLYRDPPLRAAWLLRSGGSAAAAAVAGGEADAGAMALPDFFDAVDAGWPLVAIGALTRRFAGQLVVAGSQPLERTLAALLAGRWRGAPLGAQTGGDGTERFVRALWLQQSGAAGEPPPLLTTDPLQGEPRYVGYQTGEALVAALRDSRIAGYVGHAMASAQSTLLGENVVVTNFSAGATAPQAAAAHCTILVTHRDKARDAVAARFLGLLLAACGRAASELSGADGAASALRALPDFDPLHLARAMQLDSPSPEATVYATDAKLPDGALSALAAIRGLAGRPTSVSLSALVAALG